MITLQEVRVGNYLWFNGQTVEITSLSKQKIGFQYLSNPNEEVFRPIGSIDLSGIEVTILLIKHLHFVTYGAGKIGDMEEYTDGRIILRFHSEGVSVFTPIDMPWATPHFPLQTYHITQLHTLHELQNLYFDLFKVELEVATITA